MRGPLTWSVGLAAIPILGWVASLLHNWCLGGHFFFYSPLSYLPLCLVTAPLQSILGWLSRAFGEQTHGVIFVYALMASAIYGLVGFGIGYVCKRREHT